MVWVGGIGVDEGREDGLAGFLPGLPEAAVEFAGGAELGGVEFHDEKIIEDVEEGGCASESEDYEVVCVVHGEVARYVCGETAGFA